MEDFLNKITIGSNVYRYSFNGKEKDDETQTQDYGMRIYDYRLGKFLSVDPLTKEYCYLTPYQFSGNGPIENVDLDGLEPLKNKLVTQEMREGKSPIKNPTWSQVLPQTSTTNVPKEKQKLNNNNKPKDNFNPISDPLDRAGLEVSGEINVGNEFGGEIVLQGYGRSETDMDYNIEGNSFGNKSTGSGKITNVNLTFNFMIDLSGDNPEKYQTKVGETPISVEPYIKCSLGIAMVEYNFSTRELKGGVGISLDSTPLDACDFGVKEKISNLKITNDPVFNAK